MLSRLRFERIADDVYDISILDDTKLNKKAVEVAKALLTLIATGQIKIFKKDRGMRFMGETRG